MATTAVDFRVGSVEAETRKASVIKSLILDAEGGGAMTTRATRLAVQSGRNAPTEGLAMGVLMASVAAIGVGNGAALFAVASETSGLCMRPLQWIARP